MREFSEKELFTNSPVADPPNRDRTWIVKKGVVYTPILSIIEHLFFTDNDHRTTKQGGFIERGMHLLDDVGENGYPLVFIAFDKPMLEMGRFIIGVIIEGQHLTPSDDNEFVDNIAGRKV